MLMVEAPQQQDTSYIAPIVFIENVEINKNTYKVFYSISDSDNSWMNSENVLKSFYVYVSINDTLTQKVLLNDLRINSQIKANRIIDSLTFTLPEDSKDISITAYCASDTITGTKTTEIVKINSIIQKAVVDNNKLNYLTKFLNIELLSRRLSIPDIKGVSQPELPSYDLLTSYTVDKRAQIGFVFDLDEYLKAFSPTYRILSQFPNWKSNLLFNSTIDFEKTRFFKENVTLEDKNYSLIDNPIRRYTLNNDGSDYKLLLTTTFANEKTDRSKYKIKIKLLVNDYSYDLINKDLLTGLTKAQNFIKNYKNTFELYSKNNLIQNPNYYFFENDYTEEFISEANEVINRLVYISTTFFSTIDDGDAFLTLMTSIMHPLLVKSSLLEKLLEFVISLKEQLYSLLPDSTNLLGMIDSDGLKSTAEYEYEFQKKNDKLYVDFDYDENYGYEVIESSNYNVRQSSLENGFKFLNESDLKLRRLYESKKYLSNASDQLVNTINDFSISYVDLNDKHYEFLTASAALDSSFKNAFVKINEYNNHEFRYRNPESFFYQLADRGILVKTISGASNGSVNSLMKSVLFDPNIDSSQKSLEFLTSTGIENFYYFLDENSVKPIVSSSFHLTYSNGSTTDGGPKYLFIAESSSADTKPRDLFLFNSLFTLSASVYAYYSIYYVQPSDVNETFFRKKLKHFNELFVYKNQVTISTPQPVVFVNFDVTNELMYNIPSMYYNRQEQAASFTISVENL